MQLGDERFALKFTLLLFGSTVGFSQTVVALATWYAAFIADYMRGTECGNFKMKLMIFRQVDAQNLLTSKPCKSNICASIHI